MLTPDEIAERLAQPFDSNAISWRVGATAGDKKTGIALAYLDARDVMDRLDHILGVAGWQCRYSHANGKTVCDIGIRFGDEWVWKADGAGDTDYEAEKGALSDAFKRAAVRWGIGRYLYGLRAPWVEIEPMGAKGFKIKKGEYTKLRACLTQHTGISAKSAAQMQRDKDYEYFKEKLSEATDLEDLGAIGREIKQALPSLPVSARDPLHDLYLSRREEIIEANNLEQAA